MMKNAGMLVAGIVISFLSHGQKFTSDKSFVKFYSHATIEDITAVNAESSSIFNEATGEVVYSIPIKEFAFDKPLMKAHFNDKYMESDKFPKGTFQGKISGYQPSVTGIQNAMATGKLDIHGVTQEVQIPGTMENVNGVLTMKAKYILKLADYNIEIPKLLWQKIAEQVEVTIEFNYKPL